MYVQRMVAVGTVALVLVVGITAAVARISIDASTQSNPPPVHSKTPGTPAREGTKLACDYSSFAKCMEECGIHWHGCQAATQSDAERAFCERRRNNCRGACYRLNKC
jgi:hypothetical protein